MTTEKALEVFELLVKQSECFNCHLYPVCITEPKGYCVQALKTIRKELENETKI